MAGHVGLGIKVGKEVQIAIKGALVDAKLQLIPVRRGYWGNKIGHVHTVPGKVTGKCASVRGKLIPAPRGTGIVGAPVSKKLLQFAGIDDCYTQTTGHTRTAENFIKATYEALSKTYQNLEELAKKPVARGPRDGERGRGRGRGGGRGRGFGGDRDGRRDGPPRRGRGDGPPRESAE